MGKVILKLFLVNIFVLMPITSVYAIPQLNEANGHYYDVINVSGSPMTWQQARDHAATYTYLGMQGHLATITSFSESYFLVDYLWTNIAITFNWIGGYQLDNQSADDVGWQWITGESWSDGSLLWDFWNGQPDDGPNTIDVEDNESNCLAATFDSFLSRDMLVSMDMPCNELGTHLIIEYEPNTCVGDVCYIPCEPGNCPASSCKIYMPTNP